MPGGGPRGGGSSAGSGRLGVRNADELSVLEQAHLDRRQQRHEGAGPLSPAVSEGEEEEGGVDVEDAAIFDSDFEGVDMEELQATPVLCDCCGMNFLACEHRGSFITAVFRVCE